MTEGLITAVLIPQNCGKEMFYDRGLHMTEGLDTTKLYLHFLFYYSNFYPEKKGGA